MNSLLTKLSALLRSPTLTYTALAILARASPLLLGPLYTRRLSTAEYGELALLQTFAAILPMVASLGMQAAVTRFFFEEDKPAGLFRAGTVARWISLFGIATTILAVTAAMSIDAIGLGGWPPLTWSCLCVCVFALGSLVLSVPVALLRAQQRPSAVGVLQLGDFASMVGGGIVLVGALGLGLRGALGAMLFNGLSNALLGFSYIFLRYRGDFAVSTLRQALRFSLPFLPHFVANQLLTIGDRWVMSSFGLKAKLGTYALASQLSSPASLVVGAWNDSASPRTGEVARTSGKAGMKAALWTETRNYLVVAIGMGVLVSLAAPIVPFVFTRDFGDTALYLPVICLSIVAEAAYYPMTNVIFFANENRWIPVMTVTAGLVSLVANVALIPVFGTWGALLSRLIAMSLRTGMAVYFARRALKVVGAMKESP